MKEEKERYEVKRLDYSLNVKLVDNNEPDYRYIIFDSVNDKELAKLETVCDWLNQKDKRIKELEKELAKQKEKYDELYGCYKKTSSEDLYDKYRLAEENQQLKQQLKEYSELGTPKEINDAYKSRNILSINLQDVNRLVDDLVKQLHDLPKKIVGEIKNLSIFDFKEFEESKIRRYGITETALDTILKRYGGENDRKRV